MYVDDSLKEKRQGRVFWGGSNLDYFHPPMTYVKVSPSTKIGF